MRAAWYERQGPARGVLVVCDTPVQEPGPGEVRIRVAVSGVNPGDVKKRRDEFGYGMPYPRVIPHSDGAGVVEQIGSGVSEDRIGQRVWCYGAQSYRPFGTAAEFCIVPEELAVPPPEHVSFEQGACLGIPAITAHRAVHAGGSVVGRWVLVQGGAGAVGMCAVQLANRAGARVIATSGLRRSPLRVSTPCMTREKTCQRTWISARAPVPAAPSSASTSISPLTCCERSTRRLVDSGSPGKHSSRSASRTHS